jgi:hypothetical protein
MPSKILLVVAACVFGLAQANAGTGGSYKLITEIPIGGAVGIS